VRPALYRAAFSVDKHRRLNFRNGFDHLEDRVHLRRISDDVLYASAFALGAAECTVLIDQGLLLERLLYDKFQLFDIERFLNEVIGSELESFASGLDGGKGRHQNHPQIRLAFTYGA